MEEQFPKQALDKFRQWHFWWLVVFSFLLIMTFVYYLPTMFLRQVQQMNTTMQGGAPMASNMVMPTGMVMPGASPTPVSTTVVQATNQPQISPANSVQPTVTPDNSMQNMPNMQMAPGSMMTHTIVYHDESAPKSGLFVDMTAKSAPYKVGSPVKFDFFVNNKPGNTAVSVSSLDINHQKLMHVIGIRSDMSEFFHIHPAISSDNPAVMTINHTFTKPGTYKIWSDIMKDNLGHVYSHPSITVQGNGPTEEKKISLDRVVVADGYQATLKADATVVKNKLAIISFDLHTAAGGLVEIEPYLGVPMHLTIIKDDWTQFIHAHPGMMMQMLTPTGTPAPSQTPKTSWLYNIINTAYAHDVTMANGSVPILDFYVNFPDVGYYKAFVQFRPKGSTLPADEAITIPFWIKVEPKAPFPIPQWWFLLILSVISMAGLSWWVRRYLKVKPEDVQIKK